MKLAPGLRLHRLVPALRGAALVAGLTWVLAGTLAGGHDHHALGASSAPLSGDDCAVCTLAHAPAPGPSTAPSPFPVAPCALATPSRPSPAPPSAPFALPDGRAPPAA